MKSIGFRFVFLGLAAAGVLSAGCSGGERARGADPQATGVVGMQLTVPGGVQLATLSYTVAGPGTYSGTVDLRGASAIAVALADVAPGSGYTLTETATTADGLVTCSGQSAPFTIVAGATTGVSVGLACSASTDAGGLTSTTDTGNCATVTSAVATPSVANVGATVQLTAAAIAPDRSALTYAWSASAGTIDTPSAASAVFTCPSTAGDVTVTLIASDGSVPADVTCPVAASTTKLTVTCKAVAPPPPVPCTTPGQTGCVACSGNASGACSATEAALVQHDIAAGHAATTDCYSCMLNAGCIDDTSFGDSGHECEDLAGTFGPNGKTSSSLCAATVQCVFQTSCQGNDVSDCFCGIGVSSAACQTIATPTGPCYAQEVEGLGFSDDTHVLQDYTDTSRPAGMANQLFACAKSNDCAACLR
jgi:hypothetical protein